MTSKSIPYPVPQNTQEWADDFLFEIGAPATSSNVGYIEAWEAHESPSGYGYNPLGTEETQPGSTVVPQDVGTGATVQAYTSWKSGFQAILATLKGDTGNATLVSDLRAGNASYSELSSAQKLGSWATGGESNLSSPGTSTPFLFGGSQGESLEAPAVSGFKSGSRGVLGDIGYTLLNPFATGGQVGTDIANASGLSNSDLGNDFKSVISSVAGGVAKGVLGWIEEGAADVVFVGFGLLLVILGLAIAFKSEGEEAAPVAEAAAA